MTTPAPAIASIMIVSRDVVLEIKEYQPAQLLCYVQVEVYSDRFEFCIERTAFYFIATEKTGNEAE